jgi:hypothetical protein
MNTDTAVDFVVALLVIMVVALQVQVIKINKKIGDLSGGADKK